MWNSIASRMSCIASSRLSPTATQPGRSGTYAPTEVSPCSMMTTYSIRFHIVFFQRCLLPDASECSDRHIDTELTRDRYRSGLGWMTELPVTAACPDELPTVCLEGADDLPHFHAPVSMPNEWQNVQGHGKVDRTLRPILPEFTPRPPRQRSRAE